MVERDDVLRVAAGVMGEVGVGVDGGGVGAGAGVDEGVVRGWFPSDADLVRGVFGWYAGVLCAGPRRFVRLADVRCWVDEQVVSARVGEVGSSWGFGVVVRRAVGDPVACVAVGEV